MRALRADAACFEWNLGSLRVFIDYQGRTRPRIALPRCPSHRYAKNDVAQLDAVIWGYRPLADNLRAVDLRSVS